MKLSPKGGDQTQVVNEILNRKTTMQTTKRALPWAALNCVFALLVYLDLGQGSVMRFLGGELAILYYLECFVGLVFGYNCLVHLIKYAWVHLYQKPVQVSTQQKKLFRILDTDTGFGLKTPPPVGAPEKRRDFLGSFVLPSASTPLSCSLPNSPLNASAASWTSASSGLGGNVSLSSSSWDYYANPAQRPPLDTTSGSDRSPSLTQATAGSLRWRHGSLGTRRSPNCSLLEWSVEDDRSLERFLAEHKESDHSSAFDSVGADMMSSPHGAADSVLPRAGHYQTATRSPQSAHGDDPDSTATFTGDSDWSKWSGDKQLDRWVENLRKWINQTILARLASEVDSVNSTLQRLGSSDLRVGEASQSTLRQVSLSKGPQVPTLAALLPYLDLSPNQEYLVQRIKELSKGGCMSGFRWNGGSSNYKGKPWGDYLPTDSAIVLHMFCTYLDSRLPPDPRFPDGKTFTSQFFSKAPDKPHTGKDTLCIHQSSLFPPHYKVVVGEAVWDLPKGRNNLFYALLLFLHHIKTKHGGMLGRISLGLSGVNLLWVVDG